jgi:hypothetical protein
MGKGKEPSADKSSRGSTHREIKLSFGLSDANKNNEVWVEGCEGLKVTVEAASSDGATSFLLSRRRDTGSTLIFCSFMNLSRPDSLTTCFKAILDGETVLEEGGKMAIAKEWRLAISELWEKYETCANDPSIFIKLSVKQGRLLSEVEHRPAFWSAYVCDFPTLVDVTGKKPKFPVSVVDYDDVVVYAQHDKRQVKLVYLFSRSEVGELYLFHGFHFMDFLGEVGGFPSARGWKKTLKAQAAEQVTFVLAKAPELRGSRVVCAYLEPWGECVDGYRQRVALGGKAWTDYLD